MALQDALSNYLADKWGLSASGLTLLEIQRRLKFPEMPEHTVQMLKTLWAEADLIRYAPGGATSPDLNKRLADTLAVLASLEKHL